MSLTGVSSARATPSPSQPIAWHTERALVEGTGCESGVDAFAIVSGQDVSMVFTNLKVDLSRSGGSWDTAGRSQCSVRIPVDIARGTYLTHLWQTLSVNVTKSDNANVSAGANSSFFNIATSSPQIASPSGWGTSLYRAQLSATTDDALSPDTFCRSARAGGTAPGLFRANVGVSAQRDGVLDDASIGAGPTDVRFDVQTSWAYCP